MSRAVRALTGVAGRTHLPGGDPPSGAGGVPCRRGPSPARPAPKFGGETLCAGAAAEAPPGSGGQVRGCRRHPPGSGGRVGELAAGSPPRPREQPLHAGTAQPRGAGTFSGGSGRRRRHGGRAPRDEGQPRPPACPWRGAPAPGAAPRGCGASPPVEGMAEPQLRHRAGLRSAHRATFLPSPHTHTHPSVVTHRESGIRGTSPE